MNFETFDGISTQRFDDDDQTKFESFQCKAKTSGDCPFPNEEPLPCGECFAAVRDHEKIIEGLDERDLIVRERGSTCARETLVITQGENRPISRNVIRLRNSDGTVTPKRYTTEV
jgi:hypothetical protein